MLKIYGVYRSRASRPLWLLAELGLTFDHVPVIQASRLERSDAADAPLNTASPAYLEVNPLGQIPCMEDDGLILTESLAITLHIARQHGGGIGPASEAEDAQMVNWALFAATSIEPPALEIQLIQRAGGEASAEGQAAISIAAERLRRPFDRLERHLATQDWLVGSRFTVADLNTAEVVRYAQGHAPLLEARPALADWLGRCQSRPAFREMMQHRLAEPE
ncbi:glutathione S-transferase family protein [Cereibacter sphaeroides]|uniref:glutathione S-transferase family protein n=1 Tax=Rhodobacterales TaxID=204455 RepID=UPI000BBE0C7A|nr:MULTISPECIES: glutathione S-transferase family protein [Paracoccaceae]MCE6951719.1 glutathione S-transferase family protein [Cereibacter sphaeroides]